MKQFSIILFLCISFSQTFSQKNYFISDTLGFNVDSLTKDTAYFLGEIWYLDKIDSINRTLDFDKDYSKHTMKFEFSSSGICYVEAGWMSCGKYGMDFLLRYQINDNKLSILDPDKSISESLSGEFIIADYTTVRMKLNRSKKLSDSEIEEILKRLPY